MKRALIALGAVLLGVVVVPAALAHPRLGAPQSADTSKACPAGTMVVNVTMTIAGDDDIAAAGDAWASDTYTRILQVVKVGPSSYCAAVRDSGTFTSYGGASPGGTGRIAPGDTGTFGGGFKTATFTGSFRPLAPTSGSLGAFVGAPDWQSFYFTNLRGFGLGRWSWTYYEGGYYGTGEWWGSTYAGSCNDITS